MILFTHVIFVFFLAKDSILLALDEVLRESFSKKKAEVELRLLAAEEEETGHEEVVGES